MTPTRPESPPCHRRLKTFRHTRGAGFLFIVRINRGKPVKPDIHIILPPSLDKIHLISGAPRYHEHLDQDVPNPEPTCQANCPRGPYLACSSGVEIFKSAPLAVLDSWAAPPPRTSAPSRRPDQHEQPTQTSSRSPHPIAVQRFRSA